MFIIIAELLLIAAFSGTGMPPGQKGYEGYPG